MAFLVCLLFRESIGVAITKSLVIFVRKVLFLVTTEVCLDILYKTQGLGSMGQFMPKMGATMHTICIIECLAHASHIKCKIAKQISVRNTTYLPAHVHFAGYKTQLTDRVLP